MRGGADGNTRARGSLSKLRVRIAVAAVFSAALGFGLYAPSRAADVDINTSTNNGFVLDGFAGTTVQIEAGVTVSNTTFNFNCSGNLTALCATTKAWTATNLGTIGPADFGTGVLFNAGGAVINWGSISGGKAITIEGGASG